MQGDAASRAEGAEACIQRTPKYLLGTRKRADEAFENSGPMGLIFVYRASSITS